MDLSLLEHLKSVAEGVPDLERWSDWFERNDGALKQALPRTQYLDLKVNRIKAIPALLAKHGISFVASSHYEYIGGGTGRCRECGAKYQGTRNFIYCPNRCKSYYTDRRPGAR